MLGTLMRRQHGCIHSEEITHFAQQRVRRRVRAFVATDSSELSGAERAVLASKRPLRWPVQAQRVHGDMRLLPSDIWTVGTSKGLLSGVKALVAYLAGHLPRREVAKSGRDGVTT